MSEATTENAGTSASTEGTAGSKPPEGYVSKAELDKVLGEMHKHKTTAKEATEKLKTIEMNGLKEKEDWKKLAELKEQEAKEATEKADKIQSSYVNGIKFSAVKEAALKAGLDPRAVGDLELLDISDVRIETTNTGKISALGADEFIGRIKTLKPYLFGAVKTNVNSSIPGVTGSSVLTEKDIIKLSLEASKSGDYTAYNRATQQFKQQRKR